MILKVDQRTSIAIFLRMQIVNRYLESFQNHKSQGKHKNTSMATFSYLSGWLLWRNQKINNFRAIKDRKIMCIRVTKVVTEESCNRL